MRKLAVILAVLLLLDVGGAAPQKKYVALTFDDGPTGKYTERLLDILAAENVPATFFLCGYRVGQYPALTARLAREGHELGLHGLAHSYFSELTQSALSEELTKESFLIAEAAGVAPKLVRPPGGKLPQDIAPLKDLSVILWSVDPLDWATDDEALIVRRILKAVRPGDIILMHDASDSSVNAAAEIIRQLKAQGYTFVTVSNLAAACGAVLEPGAVYHRFGG